MYREDAFLLFTHISQSAFLYQRGVAFDVFFKVIYIWEESSLPLTYPVSRFQSEIKGEILPSRELFFNRCFGASALQVSV